MQTGIYALTIWNVKWNENGVVFIDYCPLLAIKFAVLYFSLKW